VRKFVKVYFISERKEVRASEVRKAVKRDLAWSWHFMGNSSYLNGDVGITGGDSELAMVRAAFGDASVPRLAPVAAVQARAPPPSSELAREALA
jgi:hypothetical protein